MMKPNYVRVIIDRAIQRELDYSVPETLADRIGIGSRVRVPFRDKSALATVLATLEQSDAKGIRPIEALVGEAPAISASLLELAKWMSAYYCCPLETVMRSLLPQVIRRAEIGWKKQLFVQPMTTIDAEKIDNLRKRAPRQAELLEAIAKLEKPMPAAQLLRKTSFDNQTLRALAKRGLIELREEAVERDPHADEQFIATTNLELNEEHETTYKQEEAPRYHARDVAVVRAKIEKCAVVLGSATPSLESYYNATIGKYELLTLTQRVDDQRMPLMRIVDLRLERRKGKVAPILSEKLSQAIAARLEKREQTILFLNRRGFSTSLLCSNCGEARNCPNCSVALTFHRHMARLSCHLCGHTAAVPKKCPECGKDSLIYAGFGTEKVESTVSHLFSKANVRRMDADSMTRKEAYRETLRNFGTGKIDILVGTQMIAKGLHFPNVTLVGIINADLALHLPDFRAGERTFQLLTQVAGRAGRGETPGQVFVQTYTPFSPSIQFARHHDFAGYFQQELEFRERCDFPPFKHAVLITVRSAHETRAQFSAETIARRLKEALPAEFILSAPSPAPLEKLQGQFRFHILMRGEAIMRLSRLVRETLDKLPLPEDVSASVDVDPYQLL